METRIVDKDILTQLFYEHFLFEAIVRKNGIEMDDETMASHFFEAERIVNELPKEE